MSSSSESDSNLGETSSRCLKRTKYMQTYKKQWENNLKYSGWIKHSSKGVNFAFCSCCAKHINVSSGTDAVDKHANRKIHMDKAKAMKSQSKLQFDRITNKSEDQRKAEIRLCAFLVEHNLPFTIMDHLPDLLKTINPDVIKELKCARTKSQNIVEKIMGKYSFEILCEDLRRKKFSLIIDESTDLSTTKHLCLVVRYEKNYVIQDSFLSLIPLASADANTLFQAVLSFFAEHNIPYKDNLIGFASDGANVMMGSKHSFMTLLKNEIPEIFIMKCICHSYHLCASYACEKLPRFVEDLVRDIHNYFSSSPKRISQYREFQSFCNVKFHKILHPSQTRWLSVHAAVSRILEQYNALKLFFTDAVQNNELLAAENILVKLNDVTTLLFLSFLDFVLPLFNNINKEMQSQSPKIHLVYSKICSTLKTLFDCFLKREYILDKSIENIDFRNSRNYLDLEQIYYGARVQNIFYNHTDLTPEQKHLFQLRCLDFYIESCNQIVKRMPLESNKLKELSNIGPAKVKSGEISSITHMCGLFPGLVLSSTSSNIPTQVIDTEWRLLRNTEEIKDLDEDVEQFWKGVTKFKNGDGTPTFSHLTSFIFNLLSLPQSSANVERIFSTVNILKTKRRNRLSTETITGTYFTR
ncbi:uncharacterized protein [Diabrotica undecimpunctata]|uniref:uncharacterized protein n=1 Tax=Diabrotica undecimpunctata TaxID=50387 RepID=UPI003B633BB7